uniref:Uncharacterized protein n=1 Tax=Oryza glaberrima TaxID=4538 RepID=A0A679BB11_ORYGL|nr:hypothetical protein [Oryza glaberrima]
MEMAKAAHVNSAYVAPQISAENMEMIPQFHFPRLLVALLPHVHPQFCITSVHGHTHKGQLASVHHPTGTELDGFSSWNSAAVDVGVGAEAVRLCCRTCGVHPGALGHHLRPDIAPHQVRPVCRLWPRRSCLLPGHSEGRGRHDAPLCVLQPQLRS